MKIIERHYMIDKPTRLLAEKLSSEKVLSKQAVGSQNVRQNKC